MKHLIISVIGSIALFGAVSSASAEDLTIRWGTSPGYKPFIYKNVDGSLAGFDYDIGEALCTELKARCVWVEQSWDGIIPGLLARKYDAILGEMSITDERKKVIDFTIKYTNSPSAFVARTGTPFSETSTLDGVSVGVQAGSTQEKFIAAKYPKANIKTYPSQDEIWLDLVAGRIDTTFASSPQAEDWMKTASGKGFTFVSKPYDSVEFFGDGAGIGVRKGDTALRDKLSAAIKAIRANGEYAKINARYFKTDIYGGE